MGTALETEWDFWEFVSCALCHLLFVPNDKGPPAVPFWLTECGHIVCNNHLNPDRSCPKCGDQDIELMPLQRDLEPPMVDWFRTLPHAIDGIANAVKFQQQSLASLVRHYRGQCLQFSATCDRLRNERRNLRKEVDALQREITHLRAYSGSTRDQEPSDRQNANGKRSMAEARGPSGSVKTNSSPRSITMPVPPLRLTLQSSGPPNFGRQDHGLPTQQESRPMAERPGSSRFAEQYAYQGVDSKTHGRPMTYDQSAPPRQVCAPAGLHNSMPPPPMPQTSRFKPAIDRGQAALATSQGRVSGISDTMRPPPTPQRPFSRIPQVPTHRTAEHAGSNRFLLGSAHQTTTTDAKGSAPSGRQRMAFVPGNGNGLR